jgi:hypothetical protein
MRPVRALIRFLDRQTSPRISGFQIAFDVAAGAVLPLLLLWLDRFWDPAEIGGLTPFRPYPGAFAGVGAAALVVFHLARPRRRAIVATAGGVLATTSAAAVVITTLLLPFSLLGVVFAGIGLLGLLPYLTAFSHARCAVRAWRLGGDTAVLGLVLGIVLAVGGGYAVGRIGQGAAIAAEEVVWGERDGDRRAAIRRVWLLWHWPGVELPVSRRRYHAEAEDHVGMQGSAEEDFLATWEQMTGMDDVPAAWW